MSEKKTNFLSHLLKDIKEASWSERWRALTFWLSICVFSIFFSLLIVVFYPFVRIFDKKHRSSSFVNSLWGRSILKFNPWWQIHMSGIEHLKAIGKKTVVYVANHQSQADIIVALSLGQPFRWIAKDSLFKIPFFGWGLAAGGGISVKRQDKEDATRAFQICKNLVQEGNSIFFFPEGTRSPTGKMRRFKTGAFRLAKNMNVPIVPITLSGCAQLLPKGSMIPRPTSVFVTIHPPIEPGDLTLEALIDAAYQTIALPLATPQEVTHEQVRAI